MRGMWSKESTGRDQRDRLAQTREQLGSSVWGGRMTFDRRLLEVVIVVPVAVLSRW